MTTEQSPATTTIAANELSPAAATIAPATSGTGPESKDPLPIPTEEEVKQNGFYYYFLPERERVLYKSARKTEGLREEIAAIRMKIADLQVNDPTNVPVFLRAIALLERLVKTHYLYFAREPEGQTQIPTNQMPQRFSPTPGIHMNRAMRRRIARG